MIKHSIFKYLEKAKYGYLVIKTPCGNEIDIGDKNSEIKADIKINDWALIDICISRGDIGFGEAYINELFETSDIYNVLLFFLINQEQLEDIFHSNTLYSLLFSLKSLFKRNSLKGSRKNIEFHYDLGNDFYSLWLDKSMTYSSGIFTEENCSLAKSQINKYQRILENLNQNGKNILEIGCGWAGFIDEAEKKGFKVKGLTLSKEQKAHGDNLIIKNNYQSKIILQDYRLEKDKYDNIVSIEMFEAVGKEYWDQYFAKIKECLDIKGSAMIQTITIEDAVYKKYLKTSDFIREYIFPGGLLPSKFVFHDLAKKHNLKIIDNFSFGDSYNKTLLIWLDNFDKSRNKILQLGYDKKFIKKWRFYLAYCAAGFYSKRTDVVQYLLQHSK